MDLPEIPEKKKPRDAREHLENLVNLAGIRLESHFLDNADLSQDEIGLCFTIIRASLDYNPPPELTQTMKDIHTMIVDEKTIIHMEQSEEKGRRRFKIFGRHPRQA